MTEQQRIEAFEALAKLALKIIKDEDYDVLDDVGKENVVVSAIDILRQFYRKYGKVDVSMIINEMLQGKVNDEDYEVCGNAVEAMNYVMHFEWLEEKAMCLRVDIVDSRKQIMHYRELMKNDEKALRDVESEIEAMKSDEK